MTNIKTLFWSHHADLLAKLKIQTVHIFYVMIVYLYNRRKIEEQLIFDRPANIKIVSACLTEKNKVYQSHSANLGQILLAV